MQLKDKANQKRKNQKKQMKRNNGNIFGLFVFWEVKANKNNREKARKRKDGYTNVQ